jgi:Hydrogenase/urease nickel incorporation, metallochaperone, hypA
MHELGLAEGIMTVALDMSGGRTVTRIAIRIGEEQRIVPDSLDFGFQLLAEGTDCAGAKLECVVIPGIDVLVDEVELGGNPPTILRRPGAPVIEPPHVDANAGHNGVSTAPTTSAATQGGT